MAKLTLKFQKKYKLPYGFHPLKRSKNSERN
jgi:hypothetical protein